MQRRTWLILCAILALSEFFCAPSGPAIEGCIVDVQSKGYLCTNESKVKSFRSWEQGMKLKCVSPDDTELFLKSCKQPPLYQPTFCVLNLDKQIFECSRDQVSYSLEISQADNYFCLNDIDIRRIIERCKH